MRFVQTILHTIVREKQKKPMNNIRPADMLIVMDFGWQRVQFPTAEGQLTVCE